MNRLLLWLLLVAPLAGAQINETLGDNSGDTYTGSTATNIFETNPDTVQTTGPDIGKYETGGFRMGLIVFTGIDSLPNDITVSAATLNAYLTDGEGGTHTFTAYRLLVDVDYTDPTWNEYDADGNLTWTTAGGTSSGNDRSATVTGTSESIGVTTGQYYELIQDSAQLRTDIENMAAGTVPNYGWHFERTDSEDDGTYRVFAPEDGTDGQRPYLDITYTVNGASALPIIHQQVFIDSAFDSSTDAANDAVYEQRIAVNAR